MDDAANPLQLRPGVRVQLEEIAAAIGLGVGEVDLRLRFSEGRLRWYETATVRSPPSRLDELAAGAGAGSSAVAIDPE